MADSEKEREYASGFTIDKMENGWSLGTPPCRACARPSRQGKVPPDHQNRRATGTHFRWRNGPSTDVAARVVVPQTDGVMNGVGSEPAPSIIEGRPWNTMLVSTSHWN